MKLRKGIYEEDVIEETLVKGGRSACERFRLTEQEVMDIVRPFVNEVDGIDGLCDCMRDMRDNGGSRMCFMCTGIQIGRI